jgi:hypothetical protein
MSQSEPGPLADEAVKLIGAAQEWLHRVAGNSETARIANGSPECCWCPLCQLIATVRGDRPEVTERLAETQIALAGLFRALADTAVPNTPKTAGDSRVHPIRLDDDLSSDDPPTAAG